MIADTLIVGGILQSFSIEQSGSENTGVKGRERAKANIRLSNRFFTPYPLKGDTILAPY
jgi:hypothetical protein